MAEGVSTHGVHQHKTANQGEANFVTRTYGADREEHVSTVNRSDKTNEFPRSTEWVFILFSGTGFEFQSKSLQR